MIELRMFYCPFNHSLCRTQRSDPPGFMRKTCFSPLKPYLQLRGTLLSNIYAVEMHVASATVAGRKTDEYISHRSESFPRYLLLLQQQLFTSRSFSQQHQTMIGIIRAGVARAQPMQGHSMGIRVFSRDVVLGGKLLLLGEKM